MWRTSLQLVRKQLLHQRREFKSRRILPEKAPTNASPEGPVQVIQELPPGNAARTGRAIAFTLGATCTFYAGAAIYTFENHVSLHHKLQEKTRLLWPPQKTNGEHHYKAGSIRREIHEWWRRQTPGHRTFFGILALNSVVLALWHVPRLAHIMPRYFCNSAASPVVSSMLLSTFSHSSPMHFACNMFVLYSFSDTIVALMGQQQFVATYLSAGVIASLASHFHQSASRVALTSLGASGSIMGILGIVCSLLPDSRLCIVFLPMLSFSAGTAIKTILAFDALGILLRWRFFDHAAHLGGALFGVGYAMGGHKVIVQYQQQILEQWRDIRSKWR